MQKPFVVCIRSSKLPPGKCMECDLFFGCIQNVLGSAVSTELIPGGRDMLVTASNVLQYKALITDYWLNRRIAQQVLGLDHRRTYTDIPQRPPMHAYKHLFAWCGWARPSHLVI
jgi:hypothetical protein